MSKAKRIFIVGQSGAGKGVVAEEVAKQLGWKFINADVLASVASISRSVTDVFAEVASFTINSYNGDIERDAKSIVKVYNK